MVSWTSFFAFFVALCAYLCYRQPDLVAILLPKYIDAYFIRAMYSRDKKNSGVTQMPMISRLLPIEGIEIKDIFDPSGYPVHIKNVVDVSQDNIIEILSTGNAGKNMRMISFENWTEPHFSPSCAQMSIPKVIKFDDYAKNHLFSRSAKNHTHLYAGFEAITDPAVLKDILGFDVTTLNEYRQNNLFTSNFASEILSAPMHCAPIDSLTFQLVGTKTWYFVSPDDLASLPNIPMPTCFNLPMTDDELLSKIKNIHIVKQGPGDAVYFGPHWCHAVSTEAGPNVMFNMRYNAIKKLKKGPLSLFAKLMIRKFTRSIGGLPQDNRENYPLIYEDLNSYFPNCGSSHAFNGLYEAVKNLKH